MEQKNISDVIMNRKIKPSSEADKQTQDYLRHLILYEEARLIIKDSSILDLK